jgi:TolB-like protein/Tfp pilus assembly protein PilF
MVAAPAIVLIALLALWLGRSQPRTEVLGEPAAAVEAQPPMIVVLPFENLGDPEDEYFADGMTEEITSRLAVARGLRVISRTSAMQYKKNRPPMKQIGEELGVDFVLEGTVRWARTEGGSRVRITPQLIQVSDDTHLWAETYDRVIEDIFEVQSGIASEVVRALGVMLQGDEQQVLEERPTDSIEAYQAYLRALEPLRSTLLAWDSDEQIVEQLERAVELDPGFAEAWALLCRHHAHLFVRDLDRTEARAMRAKEALEGAERADADSLKTRVARAAFYYNVIGETEQARRELEALVERYPNDRDVLTWMANIYSDRAQMDELRLVLQRIAELDPYDLSNLLFLARCYQGLRLTEETLATCDRMIEIEPTQSGGYKCKARAIRRMKGDLEAADAILRQAPDTDSFAVTYGWIFQRQWERRWDDVIELSYSLPSDNSTLASEAVAWRAAAKYFRDGKDAAHQEIEEALRNVAEALETSPDNLNLHVWSAFLHSYIGEAEAALRETDIVLQQAAIEGAGSRKLIEGYVAIVYANVGREDQALDILERLLESHYLGAMTVHELRLSPDWDALRDHPRFQALLLKYG